MNTPMKLFVPKTTTMSKDEITKKLKILQEKKALKTKLTKEIDAIQDDVIYSMQASGIDSIDVGNQRMTIKEGDPKEVEYFDPKNFKKLKEKYPDVYDEFVTTKKQMSRSAYISTSTIRQTNDFVQG